ncbi:MAG: hypothetical protein ACYDA5_00570 [Vulcanimicrobiaceae bacterium]
MPTENLHPWDALAFGVERSFACLATFTPVYISFALMACLADGFTELSLKHAELRTQAYTFANVFGSVAFFPTLTAAVRLYVPKFDLDLRRIFALFGYNIILVAAVIGGLFAFLVPAFFIAARFGPTPQAYALREARGDEPLNAFAISWEATRGRGWGTFVLLLLLFAVAALGIFVPQLLFTSALYGDRAYAFVLAPILFALYLWFQQVANLATVRWLMLSSPGE